ncbi:hypothetical protein KIPB_012678, partial [Kipferlia bialata]
CLNKTFEGHVIARQPKLVRQPLYLTTENKQVFIDAIESVYLCTLGLKQDYIYRRLGVLVPVSTLCRYTKKLGYTLKVIDTRRAYNCHLVFLPPYSPWLNGIEIAWGVVKGHIRRSCSRTAYYTNQTHSRDYLLKSEFMCALAKYERYDWTRTMESCGYCNEVDTNAILAEVIDRDK